MMISTTNTTFDQRPESLNSIGMNIAIDIGLGKVINYTMFKADSIKFVIALLIPLKTATCPLPKEPRVRGKSATPY